MSIPVDFLRSLSAGYLPDTATIQRNTPTYSGDGSADSWATVATVACRVSPAGIGGGSEEVGGSGGLDSITLWTIWLPALTDVLVTDRLVVGSRTFEVNRVGARSYEVVRECICREVT